MELIIEIVGWLLGRLDPPTEAEAEAALERAEARPPLGDRVVRWLTLVLAVVSVALAVLVPALWATNGTGGLTLLGLTVGALIGARTTYLLSRYHRNRSVL